MQRLDAILEAVQSSCFHLSPPFSSSCLLSSQGSRRAVRKTMQCPLCSQILGSRHWAPSQWAAWDRTMHGLNYCKGCDPWRVGVTQADSEKTLAKLSDCLRAFERAERRLSGFFDGVVAMVQGSGEFRRVLPAAPDGHRSTGPIRSQGGPW